MNRCFGFWRIISLLFFSMVVGCQADDVGMVLVVEEGNLLFAIVLVAWRFRQNSELFCSWIPDSACI